MQTRNEAAPRWRLLERRAHRHVAAARFGLNQGSEHGVLLTWRGGRAVQALGTGTKSAAGYVSAHVLVLYAHGDGGFGGVAVRGG